MVHECGGLVYGDGANMNALLGRAKLGELGFDVCHLNLHKTFSTPHGGGGPGAGPVCCGEILAPYLAAPVVEKNRRRRVHPVGTGGEHRQDQRVPRQLRRPGAGLHLHPHAGRGRPAVHQRQRGAERQLHHARTQGHLRAALRPHLHARGGVLRRPGSGSAVSAAWRSPSGCWTTGSTRPRCTSRSSSTRR